MTTERTYLQLSCRQGGEFDFNRNGKRLVRVNPEPTTARGRRRKARREGRASR